jgi:hypothetical protein
MYVHESRVARFDHIFKVGGNRIRQLAAGTPKAA